MGNLSQKEKVNNIQIKKIKYIDISSFFKKVPIQLPNYCTGYKRYLLNITVLKNGNILLKNNLVFTIEADGLNKNEYSIEIYNKNFTKLIYKKELNSMEELFTLKNDLICIRSYEKGTIYDVSKNKLNLIKEIKLDDIFHTFLPSNNSNNYFIGYKNKYTNKNKDKYIIEILDKNFEKINYINTNESFEFCNNIYEIYDKNLICAFFVKQKLIFWNIKENKNFKSFKLNYCTYKIWDYDNIIIKNNKFYVGNLEEILIINLDTFEIETKIKLKYRLNCFCFYNLKKNKVLAAMNNNIFIIDSKIINFQRIMKLLVILLNLKK